MPFRSRPLVPPLERHSLQTQVVSVLRRSTALTRSGSGTRESNLPTGGAVGFRGLIGWWEEQAIRDLHHAETILRFVVDKCNAGLADLFGDVLCKLLKYAPGLSASVFSTRLPVATTPQAPRSQPGCLVETGHSSGLGGRGEVAGRRAGNLSPGKRGCEHRALTVPYVRRTATDEFKMLNSITSICAAVAEAFSPAVPVAAQVQMPSP